MPNPDRLSHAAMLREMVKTYTDAGGVHDNAVAGALQLAIAHLQLQQSVNTAAAQAAAANTPAALATARAAQQKTQDAHVKQVAALVAEALAAAASGTSIPTDDSATKPHTP